MNSPQHSVRVDMLNPQRTVVHAVQGDSARTILMRLFEGSTPFDPIGGSSEIEMRVSYLKPNGAAGDYTQTTQGDPAVEQDENNLNEFLIRLDEPATNVPGFTKLNVIFAESGVILHSFPIILDVDRGSGDGTDPDEDYYTNGAYLFRANQVSKTSAMTQRVGVDNQGRLWVTPGEGGGGGGGISMLYTTVYYDNVAGKYLCDRTLSEIQQAADEGTVIVAATPDGYTTSILVLNSEAIIQVIDTSGGSAVLVEYSVSANSVFQTTRTLGPSSEAVEYVATISGSGGSYSCNHSSTEINSARSSGKVIRLVGPNGEDLMPLEVDSSGVLAVKYDAEDENIRFFEYAISANKSVTRTIQIAARATEVIESASSTAQIMPGSNKSYVFGQLASLEILSGYAAVGDWSVEFDTVGTMSSVDTYVSLPSSIVLQDTPTFEKGYHYEINCHNNHALIAGWPIPASS